MPRVLVGCAVGFAGWAWLVCLLPLCGVSLYVDGVGSSLLRLGLGVGRSGGCVCGWLRAGPGLGGVVFLPTCSWLLGVAELVPAERV